VDTPMRAAGQGMFPLVIATAAFIIVFLSIALTILFVAFGGGVSGAREQLHSQTRTGRKVAFLGTALVTLAFGAVVPYLLIDYNQGSQSKASVGGVDLTDSQARGRDLFAEYCATCHALAAANAVGKVGPDLDALRPPKGLVLDAIAKGRARGSGQMPADLLDGEEAQDVANFVAAVAGR
jgi:cytochrome c551